MIIEALLSIIWLLLNSIFEMLPNIPQMPSDVVSAINTVISTIFNNVGLLGVFVPLNVIKVIIPLWLIVDNFDKVYSLVFWVIKKIPMLNIRE